MVLEDDAENQMGGRGGKRRGIQKNQRRKDFVEHHTPKKNKVGWPRNKTTFTWEV
jgi:hypothetical protein